ncbi:hypothetical protein Daura_28440 [Dactylosporangium aurantiacum]|uniref:Lipoprotein n=1 Tax=Dactylosporangium aurantiacum TaxID=35754 RepID=A0A9Q9MI87_9ACTN|nr:hypothetical protein [Dactylosporangium aurantiacum]MDG6110472.1 hypothetical protein [Dactylosporangium aurantiacum]UWZ50742.1 hypothetical protein Daura_28440 [Dactylosporangium aurantiacum]
MTPRPLAALALLAVLAGCSPAPRTADTADPSAINTQQALDIGRRIAQCGREHGYPDMADPVLDGDRLAWPGDGPDMKERLRALEEVPECKAIISQMQALGAPRSATAVSAADMEKLKAFASCMREHGVDGFPDPKADGTFPLVGTPLETEGKSERVLAGIDACKHLYDGRIAVS